MASIDTKEEQSRKKMYIALAGGMIALGAAGFSVPLFGFYGGLSFVVMFFGFLWYMQTQLESAIDSIEIKLKME
jgi:hypothetical protein